MRESFDNNNIYIYDKHKKQIIETKEYKNVYIVKQIANNLDKFVLLLAIQRNVLLIFLAINLSNSINLDFTNIEVNQYLSSLDN